MTHDVPIHPMNTVPGLNFRNSKYLVNKKQEILGLPSNYIQVYQVVGRFAFSYRFLQFLGQPDNDAYGRFKFMGNVRVKVRLQFCYFHQRFLFLFFHRCVAVVNQKNEDQQYNYYDKGDNEDPLLIRFGIKHRFKACELFFALRFFIIGKSIEQNGLCFVSVNQVVETVRYNMVLLGKCRPVL